MTDSEAAKILKEEVEWYKGLKPLESQPKDTDKLHEALAHAVVRLTSLPEPSPEQVAEAAHQYHFTTPSAFAAVMHDAGLEYETAFAREIETAFVRGAAWLGVQGVTEVGTMGEFGVRLDMSVVARLAAAFKDGDRVVVQYRLAPATKTDNRQSNEK